MRRRERLLAVAAVILLAGTLKLTQQVYRWVVFADERTLIGRVEEQLEDAALGIIQSQISADSLRLLIDTLDADLESRRERLERYEPPALQEGISRSTESSLRADVARYNQRIGERNELLLAWRATVDSNHEYVERYNLLADSVRILATKMGESYYPISSPAEIAERRGFPENERRYP
ncbi:MAG: hypothetical protein GEU90_21450 [Gemmatimonas sp.]|nr:hypothetical protein [Gemmatimonas sp.]